MRVADDAVAVPAEMRGVHAGAVVFLGIAAANLGNYVFHLLTARALGPGDYGDVATLTALIGLVSLPLGGVQVYVARRVAHLSALGEQDRVSDFARRALKVAAVAAVALTAIFLLLVPTVSSALSISSRAAVVLTALVTLPAVMTPVVLGVAQGLQRFALLAVGIGVNPVIRIGFVVGFVAVGLGVMEAMTATFLASVTGFVIPTLLLAAVLLRRLPERRATAAGDVLQLVPVVGGLLAITLLSTADIAVAKNVFDDHTAGVYGAASLAGRVILYLPAAIVTVLLPKVSARAAANQETDDILAGSVLVTAAFCATATAVYALVPSFVVRIAFGPEFADAAGLLWLFGLVMSMFAILNVLLAYHLGRGSWRLSWLLMAGAAVQLGAFVVLHDSPRQLLTVSLVVGSALLALHEILIDPSLTRSARVALRGRRG